MIKFKFYRILRVAFGARSFVKTRPGSNTYILIKGPNIGKMITHFNEEGYVEEWPIPREEVK